MKLSGNNLREASAREPGLHHIWQAKQKRLRQHQVSIATQPAFGKTKKPETAMMV